MKSKLQQMPRLQLPWSCQTAPNVHQTCTNCSKPAGTGEKFNMYFNCILQHNCSKEQCQNLHKVQVKPNLFHCWGKKPRYLAVWDYHSKHTKMILNNRVKLRYQSLQVLVQLTKLDQDHATEMLSSQKIYIPCFNKMSLFVKPYFVRF